MLVAIWEVIAGAGAFLLRLAPWLGKLGPWLLACLPFLKRGIQVIVSKFGADTLESIKKGVFARFMQLAVITAWGVFWAVFMTGITGLGLKSIFFANPLIQGGIMTGIYFLVALAFPIKFAISITTSYIIFRLTVTQAAKAMAQGIKLLFGV